MGSMRDKFLASLKNAFTIKKDQDSFKKIHINIINQMELKGSNTYILICAILIASIGLNTNSTAVIIGAMLVSPLMGPIVAMGYSLDIYDFKLFRKSLIYYILEVIVGLLVSSIFFSLSPVTHASQELINRTSPTTFDILIAFAGGFAGIIAITRKSKGNVIPGVAIATALMPPLCTVGYGIGTGQVFFILGAGYLFLINTSFILLATIIGGKLLSLKKNEVDEKTSKRAKRITVVLAILVFLPSVFTSYLIVKKTNFNSSVNSFIQGEINDANTIGQVENSDYNTRTIIIMVYGTPLSDKEKEKADADRSLYGLEGYNIDYIQSNNLSDAQNLKGNQN